MARFGHFPQAQGLKRGFGMELETGRFGHKWSDTAADHPSMSTPDAAGDPILSEFASDTDMRELVEFFVDELGERVAAIRAAFESGDKDRLRTLAHQIKGAAGGYGFPAISNTAATLERMLLAEEAAFSNLSEQVEDLVSMLRRARA